MRGIVSRRLSFLDRPQTVERKIPDYLVIKTQKEDLRAAFSLFETSETEGITQLQAQSILWNFGFWKMTKKEFEAELSENHINASKPKLTWEELLQIVTKKYNKSGRETKIKEIFEVFDAKGRGSTNLYDVQQVLKEYLEIPVSENEINEIFEGGDMSDLNSISLKDFMDL